MPVELPLRYDLIVNTNTAKALGLARSRRRCWYAPTAGSINDARIGGTQFIIATHSPVLLTFPDADIVSLDDVPLRSIRLADTYHYQITRGILGAPERYWRHLRKEATDNEDSA